MVVVVRRGLTTLAGVVKAEVDTTAATMAMTTIPPRTNSGTKISHLQLLAADRVRVTLVLRRLRSREVRVVATGVGTMSASEWAPIVRAEAVVSYAIPFLSLFSQKQSPLVPVLISGAFSHSRMD